MSHQSYIDSLYEFGDELFIALGEDTGIYNDLNRLLRKQDSILDTMHDTWIRDWRDQSGNISTVEEFVDSEMSLLDFAIDNDAPEKLISFVRDALDILDVARIPSSWEDESWGDDEESYYE